MEVWYGILNGKMAIVQLERVLVVPFSFGMLYAYAQQESRPVSLGGNTLTLANSSSCLAETTSVRPNEHIRFAYDTIIHLVTCPMHHCRPISVHTQESKELS